jgi:acyl phosphate:glycerol-3-phosphate acyltransferase
VGDVLGGGWDALGPVGGVLVAVVVGYLVGTFPTAVIVTRFATRGQVDIRSVGSGNPGGLNTAQVVGKGWGGVVMFLDAAKGFFAGVLGWWIGGPDGAYAAATASIAGHIFPVWTHFHGGKGVATSAGAVFGVFPAFFPIDAATAAIGALGWKNATIAIRAACTVWIVASFAWWLADLPNLWGPAPTVALPISQTIGAALILGRFANPRASL